MTTTDRIDEAPDWTGALCAQTDPDSFFPEKGFTAEPAKFVCRRCPMQAECLAWALETDQRYGVWGGKTERERRAITRGRKRVAA